MERNVAAIVILLMLTVLGQGAIHAQEDVLTPDFEIQLSGMIFAARWNADETQVMVWGDDPFVHVYDVATQHEILALQHLSLGFSSSDSLFDLNWVTSAEWSPDETYILSAGADNRVKLWDAKTGYIQRVWELPSDPNNDYAAITPLWHADNQRIFVHQDGNPDVIVWDINSGEELFKLSHPGPVVSASFNPDQKRLMVQALPLTREELAARIEALVPDKDKLDADDLQGVFDQLNLPVAVYVWDTATGDLVYELPHEEMQVHIAQWSEDGSTILTSAGVDFVGPFLSIITEALFAIMEGGPEPEWDEFLSAFDGHSAIRRWDAQTGALIWENKHVSTIDFVKVSPDGSRLLTTTVDGSIEIYDAATGNLLHTLSRLLNLREVTWSEDLSQLYLLEKEPCGIGQCDTFWLNMEIESGGIVYENSYAGPYAFSRVWNPDRTLAAWSYIETKYWSDCDTDCITEVHIMDPLGNQLARLPHNGSILGPTWNAAGTRLLTTDREGYIRIWAIADGQ